MRFFRLLLVVKVRYVFCVFLRFLNCVKVVLEGFSRVSIEFFNSIGIVSGCSGCVVLVFSCFLLLWIFFKIFTYFHIVLVRSSCLVGFVCFKLCSFNVVSSDNLS